MGWVLVAVAVILFLDLLNTTTKALWAIRNVLQDILDELKSK